MKGKENETAIGKFPNGLRKNKKVPSVEELNWRLLTSAECQRLYFAGTSNGRRTIIRDLMNIRKESMTPSEYKVWKKDFCGDMKATYQSFNRGLK